MCDVLWVREKKKHQQNGQYSCCAHSIFNMLEFSLSVFIFIFVGVVVQRTETNTFCSQFFMFRTYFIYYLCTSRCLFFAVAVLISVCAIASFERKSTLFLVDFLVKWTENINRPTAQKIKNKKLYQHMGVWTVEEEKLAKFRRYGRTIYIHIEESCESSNTIEQSTIAWIVQRMRKTDERRTKTNNNVTIAETKSNISFFPTHTHAQKNQIWKYQTLKEGIRKKRSKINDIWQWDKPKGNVTIKCIDWILFFLLFFLLFFFWWNKTSGFDQLASFHQYVMFPQPNPCKFIQCIPSRGRINFKYYHLNNKSFELTWRSNKGEFCRWKKRTKLI